MTKVYRSYEEYLESFTRAKAKVMEAEDMTIPESNRGWGLLEMEDLQPMSREEFSHWYPVADKENTK